MRYAMDDCGEFPLYGYSYYLAHITYLIIGQLKIFAWQIKFQLINKTCKVKEACSFYSDWYDLQKAFQSIWDAITVSAWEPFPNRDSQLGHSRAETRMAKLHTNLDVFFFAVIVRSNFLVWWPFYFCPYAMRWKTVGKSHWMDISITLPKSLFDYWTVKDCYMPNQSSANEQNLKR